MFFLTGAFAFSWVVIVVFMLDRVCIGRVVGKNCGVSSFGRGTVTSFDLRNRRCRCCGLGGLRGGRGVGVSGLPCSVQILLRSLLHRIKRDNVGRRRIIALSG